MHNSQSTSVRPTPAGFKPGVLKGSIATLTRWWHKRAFAAPRGKRLNLALQGGGAHGAFTWGVLDALLDHPQIDFDALSGSSAGAVNAVVLTQGWLAGGRQGAKDALSAFWQEVGARVPWPLMTTGNGESISLSASTRMLANWMGMFAPTEINPLGVNPLREVLTRQIDFERIRQHSPFKLFVAATHVNTGRLRLFREHELSADMLLASACLPKIHHTVKIDGEPYWDGGYSANPAVFPLIHDSHCNDILLVLLAPHQDDDLPQGMEAIESRIQELGFKSHFLREMHMYARTLGSTPVRLTPWGTNQHGLQRKRFHLIDANGLQVLRRSETKVLAYTPFLELLRDKGREQAQLWLEHNAAFIGKRSTLNWALWKA